MPSRLGLVETLLEDFFLNTALGTLESIFFKLLATLLPTESAILLPSISNGPGCSILQTMWGEELSVNSSCEGTVLDCSSSQSISDIFLVALLLPPDIVISPPP